MISVNKKAGLCCQNCQRSESKSESEANVSEENVNANAVSKTESDEQRNPIAQDITDFDEEIVEYPTTTENTFGVDQGNECPSLQCNLFIFD